MTGKQEEISKLEQMDTGVFVLKRRALTSLINRNNKKEREDPATVSHEIAQLSSSHCLDETFHLE